MIDQMGALALPKGAALPPEWPLPELKVPADELARWREQRGLSCREPADRHAVARRGRGRQGLAAGPLRRIGARADPGRRLGLGARRPGRDRDRPRRSPRPAARGVRDLTGTDLRNAILALAAADVSVTNDSGLMHVSAAIGTPTVAIFGPTSPWHWKPLNPVAAILEPPGDEAARERARIEGNDAVRHRQHRRRGCRHRAGGGPRRARSAEPGR